MDNQPIIARLDVLAGKLALDDLGADAAMCRAAAALLRGDEPPHSLWIIRGVLYEVGVFLEAEGRYVSADTIWLALGALKALAR